MKKRLLFLLLLIATAFFSISAQTLISEDFSSAAWEAELLRINPTYSTPAANSAYLDLSSTALYMGKYLLNGAIESRPANPNCEDASISHLNSDNGGVAVAFRLRSGTAPVLDTYIEFPQISSAGTITLHVRNCNNTTNTNLYLQKYENSVWSTIKTYTIYKSDNYSSTSLDEIKTYNINSTVPVKLRLVGGSKFIDIFRVDIEAHYKAYLLAGINDALTVQAANASNIGTTLGYYSQASYDTFSAAITTAAAVNANASATQTEVDAALVTLNNAVNTFLASINKDDLQSTISAAITLQNSNSGNIGSSFAQYPQSAYDTFVSAIGSASAVNNNTVATGSEVIAAFSALNTAIATFQASLNKNDLQTGINSATTLKNNNTNNIGGSIGQYPQSSYDALVAEIASATTVYSSGTSTSTEVVGALTDLNAEISAFQASVIPAELLDIDFTKDSTYWKSEFPATSWNGPNLSVSVSDMWIENYQFNGTFGKFDAGTGVRAQPLRNDNLNKHRRWAFRIDNNGTSYFRLPVMPSAGRMTIWCKNGNESTESVFYIQKKEGSSWTTIKTIYAPPHYDRNYEQQIEEYLNITSAVELRIYGASKNVHVYKVTVDSYDATKPVEKPLKLVLLPDPQTYANNTEWEPVYASQTTWITNNSDSIKFVLCQGDMTQTNGDYQWSVAAGALTIMDGKHVPLSFCPGNHDMGSPGFANTRNTTMLNTYMPYSRYSRDQYFGGAYVNKMENNWSTFSKGNYDFLVLSLEYAPRTKVLDWAKTVIEAHPYHNVIINTHAYLGANNGLLTGISQEIGDLTGDDYANDGQHMWDNLVKLYKNIIMVFCGHILGDGEGHRVTTANNGNKVYQFLANYQGGVDGTQESRNGMLRIVDMDPENNILHIETYSPYTDQYNTDPDHNFNYTNVQYMKRNGQYVKGQATGYYYPETDKIKICIDAKKLIILNETGVDLTTKIYNVHGVMITEMKSNNTRDINVPVSGCYIVSVSDENNQYSLRRKIIVP